MITKRLKQTDYQECAQLINQGGIVAIPTDTVYGLGVLASNVEAIYHLRDIKQRPDEKALAYMVCDVEMIEAVCELTHRDYRLIERLLPGPVTLIFKKKKKLPIVDESGYDTLAVRIPNHPFILELIKHTQCGLYVPSANISGLPACVTSDQVLKQFDGLIDGCVLGEAYQGQASTIIDCTTQQLRIIREGPITWKEIMDAENI